MSRIVATVGLATARRPLRRAVLDVRHVDPVPYRRACGPLRRIYDEVERDFGLLAPPIALHSPAPGLTAAVWAMLRETLLVDAAANRAQKEAVAAAVSRANRCPYCVEVHEGASGAREATVADPRAGHLNPVVRAELDAVATTFEYLNRMVTIFLPDSPLPPAVPPTVRRGARALFAAAARRTVTPTGRSRGVADLLADVRAAAVTAIPPMGTSTDAIRLATIAETSPWRVTGSEIVAARRSLAGESGDAGIIALAALGAVRAAAATLKESDDVSP